MLGAEHNLSGMKDGSGFVHILRNAKFPASNHTVCRVLHNSGAAPQLCSRDTFQKGILPLPELFHAEPVEEPPPRNVSPCIAARYMYLVGTR